MLYVGCEDSNVYALNAATGAKLWTYTTGDLGELVTGGGQRSGLRRFDDGSVYALNATTGAKLWSSPPATSSLVAGGCQRRGLRRLGKR